MDLEGSGGLRLRADVAGPLDGRPVVLLHGGGQTRWSWHTTARVLADHGWRALSVDLRGHGESDWPEDGDYSLDAFAADVWRIAQACPEPPVLVGASLGGLAALVAVGEHAEPVASALVLVDVAARIERNGANRIAQFMGERMDEGFGSLDEVADAVAAYNPHRPRPTDFSGLEKNLRRRSDGRWVWHWDPRFLRGPSGVREETRSALVHPERLEDAARAITAPLLLVRGRVSDLLSEDGAQHLVNLGPHAELVEVSGAGHMVAGDRNDLFNDAIVGFLQRHFGSGGDQ